MFKMKHKLCLEMTSDVFMESTNSQYNWQNLPHFVTTHVYIVHHITKNITYLDMAYCS